MKSFTDYDAVVAAARQVQALPEQIVDTQGAGAAHVRAFERCLAVALWIAAAGMWAFSAPDAAVALVKLGASAGMALLGLAFWVAADAGRHRRLVEIDTAAREIRVFRQDDKGERVLNKQAGFSDLSEVTLCNGRLVALDRAGRFALSVPVRGRARERAIRRALSLS